MRTQNLFYLVIIDPFPIFTIKSQTYIVLRYFRNVAYLDSLPSNASLPLPVLVALPSLLTPISCLVMATRIFLEVARQGVVGEPVSAYFATRKGDFGG